MMKFIDIVFGPEGGPLKFILRLIKFFICLVIAYYLHGALTSSLTTIKSENLSALAKQLALANKELESAGIEFCVEKNQVSSELKSIVACKSKTIVLGFRIKKNETKQNENKTEKDFDAILVKSYSRFGIVANPTVEHSVHSLMRSVERQAIVKDDKKKPAAKSELCAGTARKLKDEQCKISESIEKLLTKVLQDDIIGDYRFATLFLGSIQFFTLAVFLLILLETAGRYLRWVAPRPTLISPKAIREDIAEIGEINTSEEKLEAYRKARVRSIEDRLIFRALSTEAKLEDNIQDMDLEKTPVEQSDISPAVRTNLSDYLTFMRQESESSLESLHTANDIMLKLAFAGTILGIGDALFSARNLDVADPVEKVLVKAEMFGGIGTAFGTTLLGVILSIFVSIVLQAVASSWVNRMERSYEFALALTDSVATLELPKRRKILSLFQFKDDHNRKKTNRLNRLELFFIGIVVIVFILLITLFYLKFFNSNVLNTLLNMF